MDCGAAEDDVLDAVDMSPEDHGLDLDALVVHGVPRHALDYLPGMTLGLW
jgi:hypothetical protein